MYDKKLLVFYPVLVAVLAIAGIDMLEKEFDAEKILSENFLKENNIKIQARDDEDKYLVHKNIAVTFFWAGEEAGEDNKNISNLPSAWDEDWAKNFGGVDDPQERKGYLAAGFVPKENSFYFALPYNDFDENGKRKEAAFEVIPWADSKKWAEDESMCKNRWIKITKDGKNAYAQWQDVGPFEEDDTGYVFGNLPPKNSVNNNAGLDVSPAVKDYLGLADIDRVDWQFIDENDIPPGPWKETITTSQIRWD